MTTTPELVFTEPPRGRAARPPRHLADLTSAERRAAVVELGEKAFRAHQPSRHSFGPLADANAPMTDLPAGTRSRLVGELLPDLLTPVRHVECDEGATRKTLWRAGDGTLI